MVTCFLVYVPMSRPEFMSLCHKIIKEFGQVPFSTSVMQGTARYEAHLNPSIKPMI